MANPLEQIIKQFTQWWTSLSTNQKILSILTGILFLFVVGGAIYWSSRPDYSVLYNNLSPQDANGIIEHIREQKIPYRLSAGGTQIEVPTAHIYDLRIELAGKGLPRGDGVGFEIFDKMSFGVTDEVQRINYLRALQSELERTIDALEVIERSRVHLVIPKEDLWFDEPFTPTASVMVKLRTPGLLSLQQAESIRYLLASAVRGLTPDRVTIVDTQGKVLSNGDDIQIGSGVSARQIEYKNRLEEGLKRKAESLLEEILGPGKAAVRVYAEVDFDQIVKEREYYEPVVGQKGLVRTEQQESITPANGQGVAGGVAGTASNLQGYPPSGRRGRVGTSKNERFTKYEMNRTIERITSATGTIQKLSVGVFIDGELTPQQLTDIQGVISHALGIDENRGDQIEVKAIPFDRQEVENQRKLLEKSQREKFWMTVLTQWVPRGLLVIVALGLLIGGTRTLQRHTDRLIQQSENGKEEIDETMDAEKILTLIKQNPMESGQILKHWLT